MTYSMKNYNPSSVLLPWVELALLDLDPKFMFDATPDPNLSPFVEVRSMGLESYSSFVASISSFYKRMTPIFRLVANAICTYELDSGKYPFPVAQHLRPFEQDKLKICNALARFLDAYRRTKGSTFGTFKSPLKLLVEMAYGISNTFAEDEIAILYDLLVESMGIKTQFIVSEAPNGMRKLDIACQTTTIPVDPESDKLHVEDFSFFSFSTPRYTFNPSFNYIGNYEIFDNLSVKLKPSDIPVKEINIKSLVGNYVGTGNRNLTRSWNNSMLTREAASSNWFRLLEEARKSFEVNDYPYIANVFSRQKGVVIGHNYGPEATASIMAWNANVMTTYSDVFNSFLKEVVAQPNIAYSKPDLSDLAGAFNGNFESVKKVLSRLFYFIRGAFPYCEETIGVEQVLSPLKILYIHAFHPYIQRYDCDDLTLLFMAFAESLGSTRIIRDMLGLQSMVRLAGDPGDDVQYHVYPVVTFSKVSNEEFIHDVSAPTDQLYWQMNHGGNKLDFIPAVQSTYIPVISKYSGRAVAGVGRFNDPKIIQL